jgi:hypothetical protein
VSLANPRNKVRSYVKLVGLCFGLKNMITYGLGEFFNAFMLYNNEAVVYYCLSSSFSTFLSLLSLIKFKKENVSLLSLYLRDSSLAPFLLPLSLQLSLSRYVFELCRLPQRPSLTLHPLGSSTPRLWPLFLLRAKGNQKEMTGKQHVGALKHQFLQYITIKNVFVLFHYQNYF